MIVGLDWVISCLGLFSQYLIGEKDRNGWLISIVNQFLWLYLCWSTGLHGFYILTAVKFYQSVKYYKKWGEVYTLPKARLRHHKKRNKRKK